MQQAHAIEPNGAFYAFYALGVLFSVLSQSTSLKPGKIVPFVSIACLPGLLSWKSWLEPIDGNFSSSAQMFGKMHRSDWECMYFFYFSQGHYNTKPFIFLHWMVWYALSGMLYHLVCYMIAFESHYESIELARHKFPYGMIAEEDNCAIFIRFLGLTS